MWVQVKLKIPNSNYIILFQKIAYQIQNLIYINKINLKNLLYNTVNFGKIEDK